MSVITSRLQILTPGNHGNSLKFLLFSQTYEWTWKGVASSTEMNCFFKWWSYTMKDLVSSFLIPVNKSKSKSTFSICSNFIGTWKLITFDVPFIYSSFILSLFWPNFNPEIIVNDFKGFKIDDHILHFSIIIMSIWYSSDLKGFMFTVIVYIDIS